jgi:hypothetical protein
MKDHAHQVDSLTRNLLRKDDAHQIDPLAFCLARSWYMSGWLALKLRDGSNFYPPGSSLDLVQGKAWLNTLLFYTDFCFGHVGDEATPVYRGLAVTSRDDVIDGRPPYWRYFFSLRAGHFNGNDVADRNIPMHLIKPGLRHNTSTCKSSIPGVAPATTNVQTIAGAKHNETVKC